MSQLTVPLGVADHLLGDPDAPVSLVEYGDYECPHCARAHGILKLVLPRLERDVVLAFRNFPLAQMHPHAFSAAEAAEAAGAQGEFWPMHDLLFEHQDSLARQDLLGYAKLLGLDVARFSEDLTSGTFAGRVRNDFLSGVRSGVNGTPTFFVDGVRYDDSWDPESLTSALRLAARAKR